jgi:hypothetical protein
LEGIEYISTSPGSSDSTAGLCSTGYVNDIERRTTMSVSAHLDELRRKHEFLSHQVEEEQRHPSSDDLRITEMKKQKLRLKEEITRLSAS